MARYVHRHRDAISGRFVRAPDSTAKRLPHLVEAAFERHVAAIEQRLRHQYGQVHGIKVRFIKFGTSLTIKSAARLSAQLEVLTERQENGQAIDLDQLHRITCAQARGLKLLGLDEKALRPPPPPKPMRSLLALLRESGKAVSVP